MKNSMQPSFPAVLLVSLAFAGCVATAKRDAYDIRPEDDHATIAAWQAENTEKLADATSSAALEKFVASPEAADALLSKVKGAYKTDTLVAEQIAAVTQMTMLPKCERATAQRAVWTAALLRAAESSEDDCRTMFFLDQLRWCGEKSQADAVRAIGAKSLAKNVGDFAAVVADELSSLGEDMLASWCALGTSITWYDANCHRFGDTFTRGYQSRVKEKLRFVSYSNRAMNGSTIGWQLRNVDVVADLYTIEHGINDWGHGVRPGTLQDYLKPSETNSTFASDYRRVIDRIRRLNPRAKIVLCTPRKGYGFRGYLPKSCDLPNKGCYLKDYVAIIRAIASYEGFEVADFYAKCGEQDELAALSIDVALHPNDAGYQRMADELVPAILRAIRK